MATKTRISTDLAQAVSDGSNVVDEGYGEFEKRVVGRKTVYRSMMTGLVADGNAMVEGPHGTGKTLSVETLGEIVGVTSGHIQGVPDLTPAKITGTHMLDPGTNTLVFLPGPLFVQLLLGDEFNRMPPSVQSAFMQACSRKKVTSWTETHDLDPLFTLIAAQNPEDTKGTFPLPENMWDRFMLWVPVHKLDDPALLVDILDRDEDEKINVKSLLDADKLLALRETRKQIVVEHEHKLFIADFVAGINNHPDVKDGPGERAAVALRRVAQADALFDGHTSTSVANIVSQAKNVMFHRTVIDGIRRNALFDTRIEAFDRVYDEVLEDVYTRSG